MVRAGKAQLSFPTRILELSMIAHSLPHQPPKKEIANTMGDCPGIRQNYWLKYIVLVAIVDDKRLKFAELRGFHYVGSPEIGS